MGTKGFQKGHIVSAETRTKISKANDGNFFRIVIKNTERNQRIAEQKSKNAKIEESEG